MHVPSHRDDVRILSLGGHPYWEDPRLREIVLLFPGDPTGRRYGMCVAVCSLNCVPSAANER
jgi:hypothetical protein